MKNFDINRFGLALKCQLLSSRRQWLRLFGILTLAMFVMDIFFTRISYQAYESTFEEFGLDSVRHFYEHIIGQTAGVGIFILFGAMMFGACYVFSWARGPCGRSRAARRHLRPRGVSLRMPGSGTPRGIRAARCRW